MVTTTVDLSVISNDEGIVILYRTDDLDNAFEGYWSDYDNRVLTEVGLPIAVISVCHAYALINRGKSFEIYCQPKGLTSDSFGRLSYLFDIS
jgi:hypothetical protein